MTLDIIHYQPVNHILQNGSELIYKLTEINLI